MRKAATVIVALAVAFSAAAYVFLDFSQITGFVVPSGSCLTLEDLFGAVMWQGEFNPTAADYIQDGLVGMWDGIENAGWNTHDSSTTLWKDLIGTSDFPLNGGIGDTSVTFNNSTSTSGAELSAAVWIELVYSVPDKKTFQLTLGSIDRGFLMINNYNGVATRYNIGRYWIGSSSGALRPQPTKNHSVNIGAKSIPSGNGYYYVNGQSVNITMTYLPSQWQSYSSATIKGSATVHSIRLYNRSLTPSEIAWNYSIDKERFNLP